MATSTNPYWAVHLMVLNCCCCIFLLMPSARCSAAVPAVYVFGDSLADVGNNNYLLLSILKADYPPNGIDFAGGQATGRFSNGKNSADFLAEKLGLPTSPPYLAITTSSDTTEAFISGVSFASAGAGILDSTNPLQCLTFNNQIDYYSEVYGALVQQIGSAQAQDHLSKSIFVFIIGSNDIIDYTTFSLVLSLISSPQEFVGSMIASLRGQLKRIYDLGARKFVFVGTGPIGCCPAQRTRNATGDCSTDANDMSAQFNSAAASLLQEMESELGDMCYSFFDAYLAFLQLIQNPESYGFAEVKAACCGQGDLNGKIGCLPISPYCPNRKDHIFWDFYHPTETTAGLLTSTIFDGSLPYVYPINVNQLSAI